MSMRRPGPLPCLAAVRGPIRIETLALCRIFRESLRSSVGLLSRVWQVAWYFVGVVRALPPDVGRTGYFVRLLLAV
jgi:hypothetical protein